MNYDLNQHASVHRWAHTRCMQLIATGIQTQIDRKHDNLLVLVHEEDQKAVPISWAEARARSKNDPSSFAFTPVVFERREDVSGTWWDMSISLPLNLPDSSSELGEELVIPIHQEEVEDAIYAGLLWLDEWLIGKQLEVPKCS